LYAHHYRGQRHPDPYHHGHAGREPAPRLHAERLARESDGSSEQRREVQRDDQPDGRFQRPGHAERERAARWRQRQLRSEPGERVIDALGDDEREHADRYLYAHHYRGQRHPDPYHHGHAGRDRAPRLHAERLARESDGDAGRRDELQRDDQPDGRHQRAGHADRERAARQRQRQLRSEPGERVIDALGNDARVHSATHFRSHHYRGQRHPDPYHHGHARREPVPRLHAQRLAREPDGDAGRRDEL